MSEKIIFVSTEVNPFAKVGGLADVAGALPKAIYNLGAEVYVFMPYYGDIQAKSKELNIEPANISGIPIDLGTEIETFELYRSNLPDTSIPIYFIRSEKYFDRMGVYLDPKTKKAFSDTAERLIFFSRAVIEAVSALKIKPDILHVNDHHTALLPMYLKKLPNIHYNWRNTKSLLTIHNLAYQGVFPRSIIDTIGLGHSLFYPEGPFEFYGDVNFLKIGIIFADAVNTVSEKYSQEIQTAEFGSKLDGVLKVNSGKLFGIINGADYNEWDPRTDSFIQYNYSVEDLSGKVKMKEALIENEFKLPFNQNLPVVGMISRMAAQKGYDILSQAIPDIMKLDIQFTILGSGQPEYERMMLDAARMYPDKMGVFIGFNNKLAHIIEAGADMFLMPSRFEPCGLNQMYSMRYGTIPVARRTGGIADSVIDVTQKPIVGTGFLFNDYTSDKLYDTIVRAVSAYQDSKKWKKIMLRAMGENFSWDVSARKYLELYKKIINNRI